MTATTGLLGTVALGGGALVVLVVAAKVVVDRSIALANHYDVPEELVAMTVIALGTSLPEIATGTIASVGIVTGSLDPSVASATVLGGNLGSSTTQQLLLVGVFLLGHGRVELTPAFLRSRYVPMLVSLALLLVLAVDGRISRVDGIALSLAYLAYLYYSYNRRQRTRGVPRTESANVARDAAVGVGGLVVLLGCSFVILETVEAVVDSLAIGGSMVGVVTIGLAAALPELTTVREAIRRRAPTLALGTLVGSNVVNSLVGVGLGGAVSGYLVPTSVVYWDLPYKIAVGLALLGYLHASDRRLGRREGVALVVLYVGFVGGRLLLFAGQ